MPTDKGETTRGGIGRRSLLAGLAGVGVGFVTAANPFAEPAGAADAQQPGDRILGAPSRTFATAAVTKSPSPITIDAAAYGAVGDNRTDSTRAIQAALNAAPLAIRGFSGNDAPARTVTLPAGRYLLSAPLKLPPNCTLAGAGPSATYLFARGRFDAVTLARSTNVQCGIRELGILCSGGGINFGNQTYGPSVLGDSRHVIENVVIVEPGASSYGLRFAGTECRINNVTIQRAAGTALYIGGSDHMLQEVTVAAGTSRGNSLVVDASNCRIVDLKVFGSRGRLAIGGLRNTLLGLEVQDTGGSHSGGVVVLTGSHSTLSGLMIDSCDGGERGVLYAGGSQNIVSGTVVAHRSGGGYAAVSGLDVSTGGGHQLDLQLVGPFRKRAIVSARKLHGNALTANAMRGTRTTTGGKGTLRPSPYDGSTYVLNGVKGDITVANPRSSVSAGGAADFWPGMTLTFVFQSSLRHTLGFGSRYALAGRAPSLSGHVSISFLYDGTTWRETHRSST